MDFDIMNLWRELARERFCSAAPKKDAVTEKLVEQNTVKKEVKQKGISGADKFQKDIVALCEYDEKLSIALKKGESYLFQISLHEVFKLCPRSARKRDRYASLIKYLSLKKIKLEIVS